MKLIGLDFETYASTDLTVHGLHRYTHCPDFKPLLAGLVEHEFYGSIPRYNSYAFDLAQNYRIARRDLIDTIGDARIVAHNAGFEQAVLGWMGIDLPSSRFVDSAVLARAAGAAGKLEVAAPQLLGVDKMAVGQDLIKLFSIPGKYQEANGNQAFDPAIIEDHAYEWAKFSEYCLLDAELSLALAAKFQLELDERELEYNAITMDMNNTGWHVDKPLVEVMQRRYELNLLETEAAFRHATGAHELNLNSHPQLVTWCADRGVRATSFDEAHIEKLHRSITRKLASHTLTPGKEHDYREVLTLLETKQVLGGSSLKKLKVILNTLGVDGRLHDQYLHIGAGATFRTTGRGAQMQNLKRLNGEGDDMDELFDVAVMWDNGKLASNLRQIFTATDPNGKLIVGDFSSVESRGLAWQAGEQWKLDAYARGDELYKVQAGLIFGIPIHEVTKDQRQVGKVGELSCGYGAGPEAVQGFATKMGVDLSEGESIRLVKDWRDANPRTVSYWYALDDALHTALQHRITATIAIPHGWVEIFPMPAPESLRKQVDDPHLMSLTIRLNLRDGTLVLKRVIHGTHEVGRNIHYWKPTERKTGDLWVNTWMNPKTKRQQSFTVYGGKLAGLLTQSLCREVFFHSLQLIHDWVSVYDNVQLVGQFHDEIVLEWSPGTVTLSQAAKVLKMAMTRTILPEFPLAAEIKSDYRYTK